MSPRLARAVTLLVMLLAVAHVTNCAIDPRRAMAVDPLDAAAVRP